MKAAIPSTANLAEGSRTATREKLESISLSDLAKKLQV